MCRRRGRAPRSRHHIDKRARSTLDSLTGTVFDDDSRILQLASAKAGGAVAPDHDEAYLAPVTRQRCTYIYSPLAVTSRDARFRFETDSAPQRRTGWLAQVFGRGYARYVYTLWARGQGGPEHVGAPYRELRDLARFRVERSGACPWSAWVHIDGRVAVLHADDTLILFRSDGSVTGATNVLRELQRDARCARYVGWSTAGQFWTECAIARWIDTTSGPRVQFVLPYGERIHFNVNGARDEAGAPGDDDDDWLVLELRDALRDGSFTVAGELARLAGRQGHKAAIPLLSELQERAPVTGSCTDDVWRYEQALPRSLAQQALVRLGATFEPTNAFGAVIQPRPANWTVALDALAPRTTPAEAFARVGSPFACTYRDGDACWEYARPTAAGWEGVRLVWQHKRLAAIARFEPAIWFG